MPYYLSPEEQQAFGRALDRSVRIVKKGKRMDESKCGAASSDATSGGTGAALTPGLLPTPRTDANEWQERDDVGLPGDMVVGADFARELERELAQATARLSDDSRRHSLAQEIDGCLKARGFYSPGADRSSDLIGAVGRALDAAKAEGREDEHKRLAPYAELRAPALKFAAKILDAFADNWATDFPGDYIETLLVECGLVDSYAPLTEEDIEQLASEGHDMSDYDPGDTYHAYNAHAEAARASLRESHQMGASPKDEGFLPFPGPDAAPPASAAPKWPTRCLNPDVNDSACPCCQRWFRARELFAVNSTQKGE